MSNAALWGGAISAGVGLLKGMGQEKQWERQRQVEALKTAYAPILGTMGDMGQRPDKFQSALDFGVKGMSLGMAMDKHNKAMNQGKPAGDANADAAVTGETSKAQQLAFGKTGAPLSQDASRQFLIDETKKAEDARFNKMFSPAKGIVDPGFDSDEVGLGLVFDGTTYSSQFDSPVKQQALQQELSTMSQTASPFMQQAAGLGVPQYQGKLAGKNGRKLYDSDAIISALNFAGGY